MRFKVFWVSLIFVISNLVVSPSWAANAVLKDTASGICTAIYLRLERKPIN